VNQLSIPLAQRLGEHAMQRGQMRAGLRCKACSRNFDAHPVLDLVRCINPHCHAFDRWCIVKRAAKNA